MKSKTKNYKRFCKILLGISILSVLGSCEFNQTYEGETYRIQEDGLYGFIDSLGQEIIQPEYLYAEHFTDDGLALVVLDTIHTTRIDSFLTYVMGYTEVENILQIQYGYINTQNKTPFIKSSYAEVKIPKYSSFSSEFLKFCENYSFYDGLAVALDCLTGRYGYINLQGDTVIPCIYQTAARFSEGLAVVQNTFDSNNKDAGKYGFINTHGEKTSEFIFDILETYHNGRSFGTINYVHHEDKDYEIDGELAKDGTGHLYIDRNKKKVQKVDKEGYDSFGFKQFVVDKNGKIIGKQLPLGYSYYNFSKEGYAVAVPNYLGQYFNFGCKFLNNNGEFLAPMEGISQENKEYVMQVQKSNVYIPNDIKLLDVTRFVDGFAAVKLYDDTWIYVDKYMLVHSPLEDYQFLEDASPFAFGIAPVKINGKWGYINTDFEFVISCKYDSCCIAEGKLCKVYQSNDDVQIISYIDRHDNIIWQQANSASPFYKTEKENIQWKRQLEQAEANINWILIISIIIIFSVLILLLIKRLHNEKAKQKNSSPNSSTHKEVHTSRQDTPNSMNDRNIISKNLSATSSSTTSLHSQLSVEKEKNNNRTFVRRVVEEEVLPPKEVINTKEEEHLSPDEIIRVNYSANNKEISDCYARVSYPKYNCVVFPYRLHQINRRGYCEENFERLLRQYLSNNMHIIGNANIALGDGARPYEPDIAIVCDSNKNIRIDIEIDEPYDGLTHEPIHYIGSGDDFRDMNLTNAGWIVIRFAEKQIYEEALSCISYLFKIVNKLDDNVKIPEELLAMKLPSSVFRWTELEAKLMATRNERERYLNHTFGVDDSENYTIEDITQTQQEKELSKLLDKLTVFEEHKTVNLDDSKRSFPQDNEIKFFPKEHIYIYKDSVELTPVSKIIESFFRKFDSLKWSKIKAEENDVSQRYMLELWDSKSTESKEVGTFLHSQIESFFNKKKTLQTYHFMYSGIEIKQDKSISIKTEWSQFMSFLDDNRLIPFRTEWRIFDIGYKIAGTIDLLCKNGEKFDIYDWKRSDKINPDESVWQYGVNGLEDFPDTRFSHYCLQQNLYRYILEKNYHLKINRMYLVVLHHSIPTYKLLEVPNLDVEIDTILSRLP